MDPNMFWHPGVQWFFPAGRENDGSTIGSWKYVFKVLESLQIHGCKYPSMSRTNYSDLFARRWGSWIGKAPLTYPIIPADHWMGRWRTCKHGQAPTSLHHKFDDFQVICLEPKNPVIFYTVIFKEYSAISKAHIYDKDAIYHSAFCPEECITPYFSYRFGGWLQQTLYRRLWGYLDCKSHLCTLIAD